MDKNTAHDLVHAWNGGMSANCPGCNGTMDDKTLIAEGKSIATKTARPRMNPDLPQSQRAPFMYDEGKKTQTDEPQEFAEVQSFVNLLSFAEDGSKLPKVVKILPVGRFDTLHGMANITNENIAEMVTHFDQDLRASSSKIGLPVDFEHGRTALKRAAGAWMKNLFAKKDDGLYARMDYTELGRGKLESGEYKCFSPSFYLHGYVSPQDGKEYDNVVTGGAFTNAPVLTHALSPIVFSEDVKFSPLTTDKKSNTLVLEITKTPEKKLSMNLSEIAKKPQGERTSDEQKFLVENKGQLSFDQYKAEGFLEDPKPAAKKEVNLSEDQIIVNKKEFDEVKAAAEAGKGAAEQLRKANLEKEVKELVFSEEGSKLPTDQITNAVELLMEMSEPQAAKYKEQLKNLPTPKQFSEIGTDKQLDFSDNPGAQWNKLVNDKMKENKELKFSEAENQLRVEQPALFEKAYAVKTA